MSPPKSEHLPTPMLCQGRSHGRGGGVPLGSEEPRRQLKKGPPKGPLECMKRSATMYKRPTITVCLTRDAA